MSFLDKAKAKAAELAGTVKEKVDDFKDNRKVDELLADLGRVIYRQRSEGVEPEDAELIESLIDALQKLEAEGAQVLRPHEPETDAEAGAAGEAGAEAPLAAPTGSATTMPPPPPPVP